jgi:uncharacterized repeat protein (TIGR01451 family)
MRNLFGKLASVLLLGVTAITWTGCQDRSCWDSPCGSVCEQPCAPTCAVDVYPQPSPQLSSTPCDPCDPCAAGNCEPFCKPQIQCCHPSSNELNCLNGINVRAKNPKMCLLGHQYPLEFEVSACDDVCDVVVSTQLPDGVTFIKSDPEALVDGKHLTWNFGGMSKGEIRNATVMLECECEGELCACFCATATPVRFCSLLCAKPILTCQKCGPEEVCPGDQVHYTITVANRGSCVAEDVVVTDNIPDGLVHSSGCRTLTYKLGCLQPCETKVVNICLTACKRGEVCNTAVVSACNADSTSCQWCTCVCCCDVEIDKVGPREVQAGGTADYKITVTNTGDKKLTEVVVTDCVPNATEIVNAAGGKINCNQVVWRLRELDVGASETFNLTLTSCTPGCHTNRVNVTSCQGCNDSAEFVTRWRGRPAINVCIRDTEDPICVGQTTSYIIEVTNQGNEQDENLAVVVRFPEQLKPLSGHGDSEGKVSGNTVTFEPIDTFAPRRALRYRIEAKAVSAGDARVVAEVSSDAFKAPITQQESTVIQ